MTKTPSPVHQTLLWVVGPPARGGAGPPRGARAAWSHDDRHAEEVLRRSRRPIHRARRVYHDHRRRGACCTNRSSSKKRSADTERASEERGREKKHARFSFVVSSVNRRLLRLLPPSPPPHQLQKTHNRKRRLHLRLVPSTEENRCHWAPRQLLPP